MAESLPAETLSWINVVPLNRREKLARWWVEDIRQRQTYSSARQRDLEFMTSIPVTDVGLLASGALREALIRQKSEKETGARAITFPRATPDGSEYFGAVAIPSRPLNVRFTTHGIEEFDEPDENN